MRQASGGRWLRWTPAIASIAPPLVIAVTVWRHGLDVPHMDQWELVPLLQAMAEGRLSLAALWAPHNEHRLLVPRLVMLGLARLTAWNIRYELAVTVLLAAGSWALRVGLECVRRYADAPDTCLRIHYPEPDVLRQRARWLEARRLSLFR